MQLIGTGIAFNYSYSISHTVLVIHYESYVMTYAGFKRQTVVSKPGIKIWPRAIWKSQGWFGY